MRRFLNENARFVRDNGRWIGGGFLLTMFSSFGQTFFVGLSGNDLRTQFDLSGGEFGGLYMLATLGSALTLPWLGRTLDFMPGWKVARFALPALALACLLVGTAPHVVVLCFALYLLRLFGQGMMTEIAYTEIGRWFAANRGRAMALVAPGMQAGYALLPPIFVLVHGWLGWRGAWIASAGLVLLIGFPAITGLLSVERVPHSAEAGYRDPRTARDWTRAQVVRDPMLYLLLIGILAPPFIGTVIFFHQGYLIALRGYDPLVFAGAFPVMAVTNVVFGLVCGHLVDRYGALRLLPFFLIPLAVASLAVGLITPVWGVYLFMFLLGISNGFTQTLLGALWPEVYGTANLGGIRAIIVSVTVLSTAIGPGITGALIDQGVALPTQMLGFAVWCVLASFALAFAANRVRRRNAAAA
ncbi:MFS transporter [Stakelama sediminis]|uniref:MFS family permease n=1 Tax=Stakelama sediminis TaxID=463200 RepID=A0A840YXQ6_9SPHN|nr:MFS transporter [Stakelama sediminis]MBB5718322.1 MFS family permease [Stakelama sediminis]